MPESVGLAWYSTGTATVTQGSTAVIGVGTNWKNAGLKVGDIFTIDRVTLYMIASVNSNTSITLLQAYAGTSGNTMNYYVIRNFAATLQAELSAQVSQLVGEYESWRDGRVNEIAIPFDFSSLYKGVWATGRSYKALDIVMYNSALYVCLMAHSSASGNTPGTAGGLHFWGSYAPAVPENIDVLNYNNAGLHNSFFRGKNLGSTFTAAQSAAIRAGTFEDLFVGDYWPMSVTYKYTDANDVEQTATATVNFRIAGCDYYLHTGEGGDLTAHHIVVIPDTVLYAARMNAENKTEGAYVGSEMYTKNLARAKALIKAAFGEAHILTHREYMQNAVTEGRPSGGAWLNSNIELMTEQMVYGGKVFGVASDGGDTVPNLYTVSKARLPLFVFRPDLASTRSGWYWLRDVVNGACFALVSYNGGTGYIDASGAGGGVRPAALIY